MECPDYKGDLRNDVTDSTDSIMDTELHIPTNDNKVISRKRATSLVSQVSVCSIVNTIIVHHTKCDDTNDDQLPGNDDSTPPAPDGGWGWVVLIAVFISMITLGINLGGFAVLYVSLVEHFQSERGITGWIGSLCSFSGNILGIVIGAFVEHFGSKVISICGALLSACGLLLSALLVNIPYLYFTYGILAGIGFTMILTSDLVLLQHYFNRKRALALGIGTSGMTIGALISSPLLNFLLNRYALSGTYIILAGIILQNAVCASFYRPLNSRHDDKIHETSEEELDRRDDNPSKKCANWENKGIFSDIIDCTPLHNVKLILFFVGVFFYHIGIRGFQGHFFSRTVYLEVDRDLAIIFQMLGEISMAISRLTISFIANINGMDRVLLYAISVTMDGVIIILLPVAQTTIPIASFAVMHGICAGCYLTLQQTVMVDVAGISQIAKITGIFSMTIAVSMGVAIPFAGFIFDVTQSYDIPYICIGAIQIIGAVDLMVLAILRRTKWKNTSNNITQENQDYDQHQEQKHCQDEDNQQ